MLQSDRPTMQELMARFKERNPLKPLKPLFPRIEASAEASDSNQGEMRQVGGKGFYSGKVIKSGLNDGLDFDLPSQELSG